MAGYYSRSVSDFLVEDDETIVQQISLRLVDHVQELRDQTLFSWRSSIPILKASLSQVTIHYPQSRDWTVIIEFPILRRQKRMDTIIIAGSTLAVVEFKVGSDTFSASDLRQVENYALDLRDFHQPSEHLRIWPVLCATKATISDLTALGEGVCAVARCGSSTLESVFTTLAADQCHRNEPQIDRQAWDKGRYKPVQPLFRPPNYFSPSTMLKISPALLQIRRTWAQPQMP